MGEKDFQNEDLDHYLALNSSPEPELLQKLRQRTSEEFEKHHMISGHVQGRFLSIMSKLKQPQHILEIGTFTGYATLCLAEGLKSDGKITTLDINADLKNFYLPYFSASGFAPQIDAVIQDAVEYLKETNDIYDLVFLDANKKQYIEYFELLIPKLKSNAIILADNTLWKGKVLENPEEHDKMTKALHDFNEYVAQDERVEVILLPLRDGISLIRKK